MSVSPEYSHGPLGLLLRPTSTTVVVQTAADKGEISTCPKDHQTVGCMTPTREEFKLPVVPPTCPRAPRKPLRVVRCKRRLSELELVVVPQEEMESLFRMRRDYNDVDDDESVRLEKKKRRKMIDGE